MNELQELRAQIDHLDESLIRTLGQRFAITERVGHLKREQALPSVDPARETKQAERIAELARQYGVEESVAQEVMRVVIDAVVRNHEAIRQAGEQ